MAFPLKKTAFIAGLILALTTQAFSQKRSAEHHRIPKTYKNVLIEQDDKSSRYGPCEPSIAVSPKNPKHIAAGAILDRYYWSEDGGLSWKKGKLQSKAAGVFGDPVLTADWAGNFYYTHLSDPTGGGWNSKEWLDRIVIQKSTDGGKTYDDGSWCGQRPPKDQDKPWLCADPKTGNIVCTWTEFDKYNSKELDKDHSRILFSQSTDGGKSWSDALAISQLEGNCLDDDDTPEGAVPAYGPNGEIYVTWSYQEKIWFDRSLDGGLTWLDTDVVVSTQKGGWAIDIKGLSRSNVMPVLVCDLSSGPERGTLYCCWGDQRNGTEDTDIFIAKSKDGGKTWSDSKRVNDDPKGHQQFLPWLAIDQSNGALYAVFYDRRNFSDNQTDLYVAASFDGAESFRNMKVTNRPFSPEESTFFGDYNHISAHNGIVRPIWTRLEDGVLSVWTAIMNF